MKKSASQLAVSTDPVDYMSVTGQSLTTGNSTNIKLVSHSEALRVDRTVLSWNFFFSFFPAIVIETCVAAGLPAALTLV